MNENINKKDILGELTDFEGKVFEFKYTDTKLFFENNRAVSQTNPMFPNVHLVCDFWQHEEDYDIQVIFPLTASYKYNTYLIYIYLWKTQQLFILGYRSHTVYPPVWNREFSFGPDYIDYINICKYVNKFIEGRLLKPFNIDYKLEGKSWNASTNSPQEIEQLLKEGKSYNIISLKAEATKDKLEFLSLEKYDRPKNS